MTPLSPRLVPEPVLRRLAAVDEALVPVQKIAVTRVPAANAIPRQIDPVGLRLMALQLENDELRAEVQQLRSA